MNRGDPKSPTTPRRTRAALSTLLACMCSIGGAACEGPRESEDVFFTPIDQPASERDIPTFEAFEAASFVDDVDGELYLVEFDRPIRGKQALREHYQQRFHAHVDKSAVRTTPAAGGDIGWGCDPSVAGANCVDDVYSGGKQLTLKYCVSNDFGASKASIVTAMAQAALAWHSAANVDFTYVSTHDASCSQSSPVPSSVTFKVAPWANQGACAYWPRSGYACVPNTVVYNTTSSYTPNTMAGVLTHELGHILGLHHEHLRVDQATAACEVKAMRYLTTYDAQSIMGYPVQWKNNGSDPCAIGGGNTLTAKDGEGIRQLYGMPTAWYVAADLI